MAQLEEITATFTAERFRFSNVDGDVIIGSAFCNSTINAEIGVKGQADVDELQPGQTYRFYGKWTTYKNKRTNQNEQQFAFQSFVREQPHGREGIIGYLKSAGEGLGLGNVRCQKLWELFGSDAVRELRENPTTVAELLCKSGLRISKENAEKIAANLREEQALEACTLDLMDVMTGRGFPKATSRMAVRTWGNRAAQVIRRNPYMLMNFRGCGFKKTDALYLDLKHDPNAIRRQGLCAWYTLARDNEGHTYFPLSVVDRGIRESISGAKLDLEKALRFAKKLGAISELYTNGNGGGIVQVGSCRWLAEGKKGKHEAELAKCVADAMREPVTMWPDAANIQGVDDHQRQALAKAFTGPIGILGGGPGTGKTWSVGCLVKHLAAKIGLQNILIGAPTGKAAVRVTENLSKHGLQIKARTWHSLLAILDRATEKKEGEKVKKFPAKVLIGDECFPAGTLVDTPDGAKKIEDIRPGDEILNAIGIDRVVAVRSKEVHRAIRINAGQATCVCSENHPIFTKRGVIVASELKPGDSILSTVASMRLLRKDNNSKKEKSRISSFLRNILLNEMVDAVRGISQKINEPRTLQKIRRRKKAILTKRFSRSAKANCENRLAESNAKRRFTKASIGIVEGDWTQANDSRRQRTTNVEASKIAFGFSRERMVRGIHSENKQRKTWLSDALQTGYCKSSSNDCSRSQWAESCCNESEKCRCEKAGVADFVRVESIDVLESGSGELDQFRDARGKCYFYDLKAARHQSFSVNGLLVHNCSMNDTDLMAAIFRARSVGCHVLLVGDVNQLPPVGHGAPLRDLIAAGLPYGELTEIKRNSGGIVEACADIRAGRRWKPADNLALFEHREPEFQIKRAIQLLHHVRDTENLDPIWDCQVVVPVNKKSPLARATLNKILQAELNVNGGVQGSPFRVGDKIVNTQNGYFPSVEIGDDVEEEAKNDRGEVYVANGELAKVLEVEASYLIAQLSNPSRTIKIPKGKASDDNEKPDADGDGVDSDKSTGTGCSWDLGYALSVHKSQGSEWSVVIVMLDDYPGAKMVCSREWLYTAISRAKDKCVLIGRRETADAMVKQVKIGKRKTLLKERIHLELATNLLAEV